jgi:hypothetical protein
MLPLLFSVVFQSVANRPLLCTRRYSWFSHSWLHKRTLTRNRSCPRSQIASFGEIEKLASIETLEEILLVGNPIFESTGTDQCKVKSEWRIEVLKRLPNLKKIDGVPVDVEEKDLAAAS